MAAQTEAAKPADLQRSRTPIYTGMAVAGSAAIAVGLGFALIYVASQSVNVPALVATSAIGLGLISGFISRLALLHRGPVVRWLVALFGLCCGLIFLGWLSKGMLGPDLISRTDLEPDWKGLGQLAFGAIAAWLAVRAWGVRPGVHGRASPRFRIGRAIVGGLHFRGSRATSAGMASATVIAPPRKRPARQKRQTQRKASTRKPISTPATARKAVARKRVRRKVRSSRPAIRLMDKVEHRCPFCLANVKPKDSRGVVECSTCHTLHHADCWAVTGTCQVPHHQK